MKEKTSCEECGLSSCDCLYLVPTDEDLSSIDDCADDGYALASAGFGTDEDYTSQDDDGYEELDFG
jgi:hypothetical protein